MSSDVVGGKAFGLARLKSAGFPVPETYVVLTEEAAVAVGETFFSHGKRVAVRSSATCEDLASASFAGQFESYLRITTTEQLLEAVRNCLASVGTKRVIDYARANGLDPARIKMAVIIQEMIEAEYAGVAFSVNPATGNEYEGVIEAVKGTAEALMQGEVNPVRTRFSVPDEKAIDKFEFFQIDPLVELVCRVERHFGCPQDIEWAYANGKLYLLQARPITKLSFSPEIGEWTDADYRDGGVSAGICVPMMSSLYAYAWETALLGFLKDVKMLGRPFECSRVFFGRPYWNLGEVKNSAAKVPGFVERDFDHDIAAHPHYEGKGRTTSMNPWNILKALPIILAYPKIARRQEEIDRGLMSTTEHCDYFDELDIARMSDADLRKETENLIRNEYIYIEANYFRTIFCLSIAKSLLKEKLGHDVDFNSLIAGVPDLPAVRLAKRMRAVANDWSDEKFKAFLHEFRYHARKELDISVPRWDEEPDYVANMTRSLRGAPVPENNKTVSDKRAKRCKTFLSLREEMRDFSTRAYYSIRRFAQEWGRRLKSRGQLNCVDDIFYLTCHELYGDLNRDWKPTVLKRHRYLERFRNYTPPNEIGAKFEMRPIVGGKKLAGIACSAGVAAGTARVIKNPAEGGKMKKGDVLVCPFTDPGWTPLIQLAAAVVTENGGMLSHASILCREFGIPAVLNIPSATTLIRDGSQITVDGNSGSVICS